MADGDFKVRVLKDGTQVLAKNLKDLHGLMELLGRYLKAASQIAFLNQQFDGIKWAPRVGSAGKPSIMGAVQDLAEGPNISESRFKDRPALVNTGTLRRSIQYQAYPKTVKIISTAPYAKLMNDGGPSSLPVTRAVKMNLASLLKSQPALRGPLGFLFRRSEVSTEVPERKFLGVAESSRKRIEEIARDYLQEKAEGA